jgi:hypothetical protein
MAVALLLCLATSAWSSTYYIAANGSDSDTGTSTSSPWLHAPGMPACSGKCAAYSPAPGDRFIFRGGDAWHLGNSSATPYVGSGGWNWSWAGNASNPIYLGVDTTWYSGSSWARPILTGDNPLTTSPVSSCTYDESSMTFLFISAANVTVDNFEILGGCWRGTQNGYSQYTGMTYIAKGQPANPANIIIENVYLHGWSHVTFSCGSGGTSGNCDGAAGIAGDSHSNGGQGNQITGVVVDGSDSDSTSFGAVLWDCYDVHNSVLRFASQGVVCNNMHTFHDNLIEHISESSDGQTHSNGFEFNSEWPGTNTVYNNLVRHITAAVAGWVNPSQVDYQYNNVVYDTIGQGWDVDPTGGGTAMYFYDNTVQGGGVGANGSWEGVLVNNIFIDGSPNGSPNSSKNSVSWTSSQATAAGYVAANNYAPSSGNCNGQTLCPVGAGANLTSSCSAAGSALCSETTTGCTYQVSTHSVTCPAQVPLSQPASGAWDIGAFRFGGVPGAPTGLTGTVTTGN